MFHEPSELGRRFSSYPLELMCRELEGRGLDPTSVLQRHGVDRATFHALTGKLPAGSMAAVADDLLRLADDPLLGLHAGTRADLAPRARHRAERADLVGRVQALLLTAPGTPPPTMTQVAERMATSERTLRRHLLAAGTTFHDLLDETRHRTAVETVMTMPEVTGAELAARLGYTDPPAFYRAFKRWTGLSLTQYRIRLCTPAADRTA